MVCYMFNIYISPEMKDFFNDKLFYSINLYHNNELL